MIAAADRLDRYWADELGCEPEALYDGGVTTCAPEHRDSPRWMGWMIPVESIVREQSTPGTGVISIIPPLADGLTQFVASRGAECLPPYGNALLPFLHTHFPHAFPKIHRILHCDATSLFTAPDVLPVSLLEPDDIHASWYRLHFDGPVFVARNERGTIVSWAAIKCKSPEVWEMAVVTENGYRGRGLASSVVSHATRAALDEGKVPLYLHDVNNQASSRVSLRVGYRPYGYELTCEAGRVMPRRG